MFLRFYIDCSETTALFHYDVTAVVWIVTCVTRDARDWYLLL
jgi:hypothetical protein